jgi:hypothetical protein
MDFIVELLRQGIPFFLLSILIVIMLKTYLIVKIKRFDLAEVFFSFFRLYNMDERKMSNNRKRIAFMRWNNLLNYYVYTVLGIVILIYLVTKNA